jgi:ATP-binding cassette, subfamily F, member 3
MGKLKPVKGSVTINGALRIGHFTQHSADNFNLKLSAVENLLEMFAEAEDQEIRSFLGKFQIQGTDALKPMMLLSGGQKSRVAFAALAYKKPHVLVIDEGSNHLSMDAVDALGRFVWCLRSLMDVCPCPDGEVICFFLYQIAICKRLAFNSGSY